MCSTRGTKQIPGPDVPATPERKGKRGRKSDYDEARNKKSGPFLLLLVMLKYSE